MGIAIFVIGQTVVACVLMIAMCVGAGVLVRKLGRPQATDGAHLMIVLVAFSVVVVAALWGAQLGDRMGIQRSDLGGLGWRDRYCVEAGETVFRTVSDVPGVYYEPPAAQFSGGRFHSSDATDRAYINLPDRRYEFLEVGRGPDSLVERFQRQDGKVVRARYDRPSAEYGFTWRSISSIEESNAGIRGEELEVFHVATREILARRVLYYYEPPSGVSHGKPVDVCPDLPFAVEYNDGQPRDSYHFVSRVLKPRALDEAAIPRLFDLYRGSGPRTKECFGYVWIGEGIEPKHLLLRQQGHDLVIGIANTADSLICQRYYWAGRDGRGRRFRFADGPALSEEGLREAAVTPEAPLKPR